MVSSRILIVQVRKQAYLKPHKLLDENQKNAGIWNPKCPFPNTLTRS